MRKAIPGVQAFPLHWPADVPRTPTSKRRVHPSFMTLLGAQIKDCYAELARHNRVHAAVISTNLPLRENGYPYSSRREPDDRGVAVYWAVGRRRQVICCDRWDKVAHNIRAIVKTLEAIRGIERWGCSDVVDRMFRGFRLLPGGAKAPQWWDVLRVPRNSEEADVRKAYHRLVREVHPELVGGGDEMLRTYINAYNAAMEEIGRR